MVFAPRDLSKPILDAFAIATAPACKADWETGLERFRPPDTLPDDFSWFGAGKPGFSLVLNASLRGIGQTQKENLSGMTYHEFVLYGKFCFGFPPRSRLLLAIGYRRNLALGAVSERLTLACAYQPEDRIRPQPRLIKLSCSRMRCCKGATMAASSIAVKRLNPSYKTLTAPKSFEMRFRSNTSFHKRELARYTHHRWPHRNAPLDKC